VTTISVCLSVCLSQTSTLTLHSTEGAAVVVTLLVIMQQSVVEAAARRLDFLMSSFRHYAYAEIF